MKKILILVVVVVGMTLGVKSEKRYSMYGVMFYNLENLFDTINNNGKYDLEFSPAGQRQWNGEKYWKKQHNMAYALSKMATKNTPNGPVLIGVSEVENITVLQDLVKQPEVRSWHLQIVHHDSPDNRGIDVGLLYNPRYFKVLNVTNQRLKIEGQPNFRTRDQLCVTGLLAGEKISVIVNHWPSRLGGQEQSNYLRIAAAKMARATIDSLMRVDPDQGVVFMGDLNDDPQDVSLTEGFNAKHNISDVEKGGVYNPWWDMLNNGIGTLAYKGQWNLFDQILVNDNLLRYHDSAEKPKLTFFKAEVMNKDFLKTKEGDRMGYPLRTYSAGVFLNGFSDHFPTQIFLVKEL